MKKFSGRLLVVVFIITVLIILVFAGCSEHTAKKLDPKEYKPAKLGEIYKDAFDGITKIRIMNQGEEAFIEDRETIDEVISKFKEMVVKRKPPEKDPPVGYLYYLDLYRNENKTIRITVAGIDSIDTDDARYEVRTPELMIDINRIVGKFVDLRWQDW